MTKVDEAHPGCTDRSTMLPSLFAIHTGRRRRSRYDFHDGPHIEHDTDDFDYTTGRLAIFQAREIHDGRGGSGPASDPWLLRDAPHNSYRITAYRIHASGEDRVDPSFFVVEGRFGYHHHHGGSHVTLFSEERGPPPAAPSRSGYYYGEYDDYDRDRMASNSIYRGHWRYSGYTAFSMYCASPIPIIVLTGSDDRPIDWPTPYYNRAAAQAGDRTMVRVWAHRWNPAVWENELEEAYEERRRPAPAPAPAAPATRVSSPSAPFPKFVADLIIADAVSKGTTCTITMEPIRADNAIVTPCYHIFDATALTAWAASQDGATICPQCRKSL